MGLLRLSGYEPGGKGLALIFEAANDLPATVELDETRLRQVLLNLLSNAIKFTDKGKVYLRVSQGDSPDPTGQTPSLPICFEVADTGVGVSEADVVKIFQPFEQVGNKQKQVGGTGLGLTITKQLVTLMGGELQMSSKLGRGSRFWFELNLPVGHTMEAAFQTQITPETIAGYDGPRHKILIADDKVANRMPLSQFLSSIGFEILEAEDGQKAIEQIEIHQPDLVLMDMIMPVLTGVEAVQQLQVMPEFAALPIIGTSASVFESDKNQMIVAGCQDFLPKPVDLGQLLILVEKYLGLNWRYKSVTVSGQADDYTGSTLVPPPYKVLKELQNLLELGFIYKVEEKAKQLQATHPEYAAFAQQLYQFAVAFQEEQAKIFIKKHLGEI